MATGILGLGSSGSNGLSQELIDKLKAAEAKAKVDPYTTKLETWDKELEKVTEIEDKVKELLSAVSNYDLYKSSPNAFAQVSANTTGTSAVFSATDTSGLTPGSTTVVVTQLAQKDVYQTNTFTDKDLQIDGGNDVGDKISITVGEIIYEFSTEAKTYQELVDDINLNDKLNASVEQVGDDEYRLVIKSKDSGEVNKLTIETTGVDLGFGNVTSSSITDFTALMGDGRLTINGNEVVSDTRFMSYDQLIDEINNYNGGGTYTASKVGDMIKIKANDGSSVSVVEDGDNGLNFQDTSHVVTAQNMKANIDGVAYNVSLNTITIQGNLSMTAVDVGTSTISIQQDSSSIKTGLEDFITKYNELVDLITTEAFEEDSSISDIGAFKNILSTVKNALFANYGTDEDQNIFSYGFSLDTFGYLSLDSTTFSTSVTNNFEDLKSLFVGVAEKPGIGTVVKEYLDSLSRYDGAFTLYGTSMGDNKAKLEEDKVEAQELLDSKYSLMAQQFASYTAMITQMEAAFGGMKMMIQQSNSSS
jgi:flagellar hook-associated protein 2